MATLSEPTFAQRILSDRATRRLGIFLASSIIAHLALLGTTGRTALQHPSVPLVLQVQLRTQVPDKPATLAVEGEAALIDLPAPMPDTKLVDIQAAAAQHPVDTQRVLNLPAAIYYTNNEVDVRAEPLEEVNLVYPVIAYQQRLHGSVTLNIFINERGDIDKVVVMESKPPGVFDEAALQAVSELKFSPASKDGKSVKNRKTIAINFDPYEKISTP